MSYDRISMIALLVFSLTAWGCAGTNEERGGSEKGAEATSSPANTTSTGSATGEKGGDAIALRAEEQAVIGVGKGEGAAIVIRSERTSTVDADRSGTEAVVGQEELLNSTTNSVTAEIARTSAVGSNSGVWGGRSNDAVSRRDGVDVGDPISGPALGYGLAISSEGEAIVVTRSTTPVDAERTGAGRIISRSDILNSLPHRASTPKNREDNVPHRSPLFLDQAPFRSATSSPFSTFSIDVDGGSYTNVRGYIERGATPQPGIVRIEELINYFTYDYPDPTGEHPFGFRTEVAPCPWDTAARLVRVALQGKRMQEGEIPPMNLVFLIDVSGSMSAANRLPMLKRSFDKLIDRLRPEDRIAIVTYAGSAGVALESTGGGEKEKIRQEVEDLTAGGSTAGGAGIQVAYEIAKKNFINDGNNRVILATDGDFNVGVSTRDDLINLIEQKRGDGIFLSVLGFGFGNYRDREMEQLADNGDGVYYYVDRLAEAERIFGEKLTGTTTTIAKDVKLQIRFNPEHVVGYRLIGYENRRLAARDFDNDRKDAGDLGAGHAVTAFYEVVLAGSDKVFAIDARKEEDYNLEDPPSDQFSRSDILHARLRYKLPDDTVSRLIEHVVPDDPRTFGETDDDFRFAAAVAHWGRILRTGEGSPHLVLDLARNASGDDPTGERGAFVDLVMTWMRQTEDLAEREREGEGERRGSTIR